MKMYDWNKAEAHLTACEKEYSVICSAGYLVLNYVIYPLRDRLNRGERSKKLWMDIMATQL
jgi:hypothetical protein